MYKTEWYIKTEEGTIGLVCYHFGKRPYFFYHFLEDEKVYEIEMLWNLKLINTFGIFLKCLFHKYIVKEYRKNGTW